MQLIGLMLSVTKDLGLGYQQGIPWHLNPEIRKDDLAAFKTVTKGCTVIMGRNTWLSLPIKPLPNRNNVIVSKTLTAEDIGLEGVTIKDSLESALSCEYTYKDNPSQILLIGGASLVNEALRKNLVHYACLYHVPGEYECDCFLDEGLFNSFVNQCNVSTFKTKIGNEVKVYMQRFKEDYDER